MNVEELKKFIGKRIFLVLKSGIHYNGNVNGVDDDSIYLIEKNGNLVIASVSEISSIEEKGQEK